MAVLATHPRFLDDCAADHAACGTPAHPSLGGVGEGRRNRRLANSMQTTTGSNKKWLHPQAFQHALLAHSQKSRRPPLGPEGSLAQPGAPCKVRGPCQPVARIPASPQSRKREAVGLACPPGCVHLGVLAPLVVPDALYDTATPLSSEMHSLTSQIQCTV